MQMIPLGSFSKLIVSAELRWYNNEPRLCLYLDVSTNPILNIYGKPIPLTSAFQSGGFKNEKKSIRAMGFTDPAVVATKHGLAYVHPFILNNILHGEGHTIQRPYLDKLLNFVKKNLGLDLSVVNASNIDTWDAVVAAAFSKKMLVSPWAQWVSRNGPFAGPDGTDQSLV